MYLAVVLIAIVFLRFISSIQTAEDTLEKRQVRQAPSLRDNYSGSYKKKYDDGELFVYCQGGWV